MWLAIGNRMFKIGPIEVERKMFFDWLKPILNFILDILSKNYSIIKFH